MDFFSRLLGRKSDNLEDELKKAAKSLVDVASIYPIGLFIPTSDKHPILRTTKSTDWDFTMTIAGVFVAATRLVSLHLDNKKEEAIMDIVTQNLNEWDRDALNAFDDCKRIYEAEYDRLSAMLEYQKDNCFLSVDAIGMWITLNILQRYPQTYEEIQLVRVTGIFVTHTFFDWWKTTN